MLKFEQLSLIFQKNLSIQKFIIIFFEIYVFKIKTVNFETQTLLFEFQR